jgi:hypothetical protein
MGSEDAWKNGTINAKENYTSKQIWAGRTPRYQNFLSNNLFSAHFS